MGAKVKFVYNVLNFVCNYMQLAPTNVAHFVLLFRG